MVLGQVKVEANSNEITAIPALSKVLHLDGAIVTIDAMGCQKAIAEQIINRGGDYVLALKGNQSGLHDDVELFLSGALAKGFEGIAHRAHETLDKGHGRVEVRRYWISEQIDW